MKNFKKYHLFGFTGTPIFSVNSGRAKNPEFFTTGQTFGCLLYTSSTVAKRNEKLVKLLNGVGEMNLGDVKDHSIDAFGAVSYTHLDVYKRQA